jgi:hypothetical protein
MKRFYALLTFLFFACGLLLAQRQMTVAQLTGFIKSSVENKLDDKLIAEELKKVKLSEKLEPRTVSDLMALGAGVRTSAALRELATASAGLPAAPPPAVAPGTPAEARLTISRPKGTMLTEPDSQEREKILDAVREYALNYTQSLPNFICTQVIRRQEDPTGTGDHYKSVDKIQEQLTYYEHQEKYKVLAVNSQMVENRDHMKMGGAMSEGEFGSMMYEIFEPSSGAEFEWTKFGKLDGVIMNVFSYKITQERSHYSIIHNDTNRVISGYHGLIYARKDDNVIIKITLECDTIPATFPIQDVKQELWYAAAKISGREFILPQKWESHSRDGHMLAFNAAEFALYRKYEAETSIKFDTDDNDDKKDENKPPDPAKPPIKKP